MNSLSLMRFVAKNGCNPLIARQLSLHSVRCMAAKPMASPLSVQNRPKSGESTTTALIARSLQQSPQQLSTRWSSSAAQSHSHAKLWSIERYVSMALLGVIPAALVVPNPALDYLLALSLVAHIHWGLEAIVVDYIRPSIFGAFIPKVMVAYVYMLSIAALAGLFYFNYTDVGLGVAIRMAAKM
ncbi:unnamed protein product [Medioppia subpectinata]|uniref:Succinate dehydrogenase [ubiquinone] cytochrome b small subunit n=1 Tax=Medioppia subpectinata TaxID=1979941 RepID=A0A7R9KJ19_9ACAR|nr:unnamed protein product [Medioppia subpectinata]CAG2103237.1 unnamed protein product [Medioppia subpectinata]